MASWYDWFWRSYLDATLAKPLNLVLSELLNRSIRISSQHQHHQQKSVVVDVACGTGEFLLRLQQAVVSEPGRWPFPLSLVRWVGVEPSGAMLDRARAKLRSDRSRNQHDYEKGCTTTMVEVELHQATAEKLLPPLEPESVDVVCCTNAFHFFRNQRQALSEFHRVLKVGGKVVMTDWCHDYWMVRWYHALERLRWRNFTHPYPGPLTSRDMTNLFFPTATSNHEASTTTNISWDQVQVGRHWVRVWSIFPWGMQTVTATKAVLEGAGNNLL